MVQCELRRSHLLLARTVLVIVFFLVWGLPWILISNLEPATHHSLSTLLEPQGTTSNLRRNPSAPVFYSCHDIFAAAPLLREGTCLRHQLLQWVACELGPTWIQPERIDGSLGGEDIDQVLNRPEAQEQLIFEKGSLLLQDTNIPSSLIQSVDVTMRRFLGSAMSISTSTHSHESKTASKGITLLVHRGNYANPCMTVLTIYNVYIILEYYYNYFQAPTRSLLIVWMDGHAKGDLDAVWTQLFQTGPLHIKQLPLAMHDDTGNQSPIPLPGRAMVVNTMSAMGDEGLGLFDWVVDGKTPSCWKNSTLVQFRNFVLERYGLLSDRSRVVVGSKILTLLVRKDYRAHPRSRGYTDRTLSNITADTIYLQSLYPNHTLQVVSFEGLPFVEQLRYMVSTDILVAVHGAGNIHVLFLPDTATFVEYIPKPFRQRRRFKYLAACLNIRYVAMPAWIETRRFVATNVTSERSRDGSQELLQVRLRPW